jgi:hypothetical protein
VRPDLEAQGVRVTTDEFVDRIRCKAARIGARAVSMQRAKEGTLRPAPWVIALPMKVAQRSGAPLRIIALAPR